VVSASEIDERETGAAAAAAIATDTEQTADTWRLESTGESAQANDVRPAHPDLTA
jgi:hypothetical protein